jgi:hypothetical protein
MLGNMKTIKDTGKESTILKAERLKIAIILMVLNNERRQY